MNEHTPEKRLRLGLTVGDPAGVGPEVLGQALRSDAAASCEIRVYGDLDALERAGGLPPNVEGRRFATARVAPGRPEPAAAAGIVDAIRAAARDCLDGELDAMVTGPISKDVLARGGFPYPGHTELLEEASGQGNAVMLLEGRGLRVALATVHCSLRDVPRLLSRDRIELVLRVLNLDLIRRFGVAAPRIAVCGLNPHAGEQGRFGDEEERIIGPAIRAARTEGIDAQGPHAGDSVFSRAVSGEFDVVLGMYHDQALAPLKVHAFGHAVNVTLGLPFVRTSVDHGTGFDIAGAGTAKADSMIQAIRLAAELAARERSQRGGR